MRPRALVTGADSGIGYETVRLLAEAGWEIILVSIQRDRGIRAVERLSEGGIERELLRVEEVDLAVLEDVGALAERLRGPGGTDRLDALLLNAGHYSNDLERTGDGFERTMAVNHLGHLLLTVGLLPLLRAAARADRGVGPPRIVWTSSVAHRHGRLRRAPLEAILRGEAWRGGFRAYGDSKLASVLMARHFDRSLADAGIRSDAVHPGIVNTGIWDDTPGFAGFLVRIGRFLMRTPAAGGQALTKPLLDPDLRLGGGRYFHREKERRPVDGDLGPEFAAELWRVSLDAVGLEDPLRAGD